MPESTIATGEGVGAGVAVGEGTGVGLGVGVAVGDGVGVGLGVGVGVAPGRITESGTFVPLTVRFEGLAGFVAEALK